jgi:predicted RNA-binding Zn-ribbon protein involved in translation (DUF1610 family)
MTARVSNTGILCPNCGEHAVMRVPSRSWSAVVRKPFTRKRPHSCRKCHWSGWLEVSAPPHATTTWTVECGPPDLESVDSALTKTRDLDASAVPPQISSDDAVPRRSGQ